MKLKAISRSSQEGSSSIEDVRKDGMLLGADKDESGSVVGFRLIPQSGIWFLTSRNLILKIMIYGAFLLIAYCFLFGNSIQVAIYSPDV